MATDQTTTIQELQNRINQLQNENRNFMFRVSDYIYEIILGFFGLFLGGYVISLGMSVLGIGIMILFFVFILLYHSYKKTRGAIPWPPVISPCPNGYYLNIAETDKQDSTETVCSPLSGSTTDFKYKKNDRTDGCAKARTSNIDWDGC
jgi:hypothetical protein